jgi:propanol-preferring alcohol dehydrogenase
MEVDSYSELLGPETELIGSNDHLLSELPELIGYAERRALDLSEVVVRTVPLDAGRINAVLDELEEFKAPLRTVITP